MTALFPAGAFERTGTHSDVAPGTRFECGICWQVYDPGEGDALGQVPAGTPFAALPERWCCPGCEAPRHKFMPIAE